MKEVNPGQAGTLTGLQSSMYGLKIARHRGFDCDRATDDGRSNLRLGKSSAVQKCR
jgi:hypothetical protein